ALEPGALARAGIDGRGRQAWPRSLLAGRSEAAWRAVARSGARREDEGRPRRAGWRLRRPGVDPARSQAARHGGRGADPVDRTQELLRPARTLPGHERLVLARKMVGARGDPAGVPRHHQPERGWYLRP